MILDMTLLHVIESQQFDRELLFSLFEHAEALRSGGGRGLLQGKILAALFYEPSTRTRFSFESAMLRLGGGVISSENAKEFSSAAKGESIEDTVRVVGAYADAIVIRHFEEGAAKKAASVSPVPIINAGDGAGQHPTQALLDVYTLWRERGTVEDITITFVGDLRYGRTVRSLCYLLGKFKGVNVVFIAPPQLAINEDIKEYLARHGVKFEEQTDLNACLPWVDAVYMTRIQKERMLEEEYNAAKNAYRMTPDNLALMKPDARLLHPLPHVDEIALPVEVEQTDKRVAYFRQAENGLYIRMALLAHVMKMHE